MPTQILFAALLLTFLAAVILAVFFVEERERRRLAEQEIAARDARSTLVAELVGECGE